MELPSTFSPVHPNVKCTNPQKRAPGPTRWHVRLPFFVLSRFREPVAGFRSSRVSGGWAVLSDFEAMGDDGEEVVHREGLTQYACRPVVEGLLPVAVAGEMQQGRGRRRSNQSSESRQGQGPGRLEARIVPNGGGRRLAHRSPGPDGSKALNNRPASIPPRPRHRNRGARPRWRSILAGASADGSKHRLRSASVAVRGRLQALVQSLTPSDSRCMRATNSCQYSRSTPAQGSPLHVSPSHQLPSNATNRASGAARWSDSTSGCRNWPGRHWATTTS